MSRVRPIDEPLQDPVDVVGVLDHGADVRVDRGPHSAVGRGDAGQPVQVGEQRRPSRSSSSTGRSSYPSWPVAAASTRVVAPAATKPFERRGDLGRTDRATDRAVRPGTKPPTARSPRSASVFAFSAGSSGRNPSGPNSVAASPTLAHLGQHGLGVVLPAPAGDLADTPGDRGTGDPGSKVSHRPISSIAGQFRARATTRFSCRDSSHASAIRKACQRVPDRARHLAAAGDHLGEGGQLGDVRRAEAVHEGHVRLRRRGRSLPARRTAARCARPARPRSSRGCRAPPSGRRGRPRCSGCR